MAERTDGSSNGEKMRLGSYDVLVKPITTFFHVMKEQKVPALPTGHDTEIYLNKIWRTYGAGPCIAGLAITENKPYIFHYDPTQFEAELPLLDQAESGLVGGDVKAYLRAHGSNNLHKFASLGDGVLSVLVNHHHPGKLDVLYMLNKRS